jgi:signal transduction histidine kinase
MDRQTDGPIDQRRALSSYPAAVDTLFMLSLRLTDHLSPDDAARLAALARTQLLDSPPEERFDRLTALAAQMLGAPVALVTLVDAHRAFLKSAFGMAGVPGRELPLSHSICKHVVAERSSVVVEDARLQPALRDNGAVTELGAVAYAGMPIVDRDGHTLGALCVIDSEPRQWSARELATLRTLADWIAAEVGRAAPTPASPAERAEWAELAEQRKFEALGRFAAAVAHDFNNVLAGVAGYADLLHGDEALDPATRHDVGEIVRAAERGRVITQQLASVARRPKPVPAPFAVNEVVQDVARSLEKGASPDITVTVHLESELPPVLADRAQLEQVLAHVIANAREAMPRGGAIALSTSLSPDARGESRVCIAVQDVGVGMDAATAEKIFEPFYTTRKLSGGRGLGLTSVRSLVAAVKGTVQVVSAPGAGCTFKVLLPIAV